MLGTQHRKDIEQIADVEADFQIGAAVIDSHFFFGLFLLRVVGLDFQQPGFQLQADAAVLFVGKNRRAAERFAQQLPIATHQLVATARQHAFVVGKFSVDQFRGEGEVASGGPNVVLPQTDRHLAVLLGEQAG